MMADVLMLVNKLLQLYLFIVFSNHSLFVFNTSFCVLTAYFCARQIVIRAVVIAQMLFRQSLMVLWAILIVSVGALFRYRDNPEQRRICRRAKSKRACLNVGEKCYWHDLQQLCNDAGYQPLMYMCHFCTKPGSCMIKRYYIKPMIYITIGIPSSNNEIKTEQTRRYYPLTHFSSSGRWILRLRRLL